MLLVTLGVVLRLLPTGALHAAAPNTCTIDWAVGDVVSRPEWDSGLTTSLSPWKTLDCSVYGPQYTLASVRVNREPKKNLDNFVARLSGVCREFTPRCTGGDGDGEHAVEVYASAYRVGDYTPGEPWTKWPDYCQLLPANWNLLAGFSLVLSEGRNYVKNVAVLGLQIYNNGSNHFDQCGASFWAIESEEAYTKGDYASLDCGENVMTGVSLRYDTRNGKIRRMKIDCRAIAERQ